jgi:poly(hydroxyalkanoate) depolymerase family esterase
MMQGLGDTTAMLTALRRTREGALSTPSPAVGRLLQETATFGANPGALRMLSYAPNGLAARSPLVVVLHGCTQGAEGHAAAGGWLALADRCGFAVLAPEQTAANNPNRCFNWFSPHDAKRGKGEAASIRAMIAAAIAQHGSDPSQVFVTGLSAGGAMTMVMLAAYPEVFAGGAVIAGLPYGAAKSVQEAMMAMQGRFSVSDAALGEAVRRAAKPPARAPRLSIWHGDSDAVVKPGNATAIAAQWAAAHGLAASPDEIRDLPGRRVEIWRARASGEVAMELQMLSGMGHGTPLSTDGAEGLGATAPFMLETGVSSTWEIARFWGIAPPADALSAAAKTQPAAASRASPGPTEAPVAGGLGQGILDMVGRHTSADVQAVIAKAFKSAGLMK